MGWIQRALGAADRLQARWPPTAVPVAVWKKFQDDQAGYLAALVSYFGFVALFPLLLIFVTVLDMTLRTHPTLHRDLLNSALMQYPVVGSEIGNSLGSINGSGLPLIIGIVVLLIGTRGVAFAMQNALCTVWGIRREQRPSFFTRWLYGLALVFVVGLGLVVTTFLSGIANGAGNLLSGFGAHAGAVGISLVANVGVFWLAFRLATMRKVPWTNLRVGAMLAAVVWQVLQVVGGYVVTHELHRASDLYGTFGVVLGLVGWLYLQATITLYCAEADAVLVTRRWPRSVRPGGGVTTDAPSVQAASPVAVAAQRVSARAKALQAVPPQAVPPQAAAPQTVPPRVVPPQAVPPRSESPQAAPSRAKAAPTQPEQKEAGHDTPVS
jgi:YihY family inner membrane protein